jgi:transposase-like protein
VTRPRGFAPEFKAQIDLYRSSEGRTIADVAREPGIGTEAVPKWVLLMHGGVQQRLTFTPRASRRARASSFHFGSVARPRTVR